MAGYIGSKASVVSSGAERKKTFAITTSTTSLTGLVYTPTKAHVFHNGVRLVDGTDYTATNGTSITLNSAAENGDEVVVISYAGFQVADAYTQAEADAEFVAKAGGTMTGGLTVGGSFTSLGIDDNATSTAVTIDSAGRVTMPYQPIVNCGISDHNTSVAHAGSGVSALYTTGHPSVVVQGGMIVSSDRVTVPVAGKYLVSARQLNLSNGGEYFNIRLNGASVGYGYNADTVHLHDMNADVILSCSASDYIQISYNTATANRWESGHSNLMIHLIG